MLAVIKTGGKQYVVAPGQTIKVEKLEGEVGKEIIFDQVLLLYKDDQLTIGTPLVPDSYVTGKVIGHIKGKKVIAFKYKSKKRYHRKRGHRQQFTQVQILKI
jgi:large subunit ribosomal protein L21